MDNVEEQQLLDEYIKGIITSPGTIGKRIYIIRDIQLVIIFKSITIPVR